MGGSSGMSSVARSRLQTAGILLLLALAPLSSGAGRAGGEGAAAGAPTVPTILAASPERNALDVSRTAQIAIQFDREMDHSSITAQSIRVAGERFGPYSGSLSFFDAPNGTLTTFIPTTPFAIGERITVVLTSQVRAIDQVPLAPYAWGFTTECQPGPISFTLDSTYFAARLPFEMYAADVNKDGYSDFAVAHTPSLAGTLSVFTGVGAGTLDFGVTTLRRTAAGPRGVHCGDLDGDGFPDIAMTTSADSSFVTLMNDRSGGFSDTTRYKTNILAYNIYGCDFDADGDMDLAMGNLQGPQILLARNDGFGNFGGFTTIVADSSPRGIEASDLDGDGDLDLVAVNANQKVSVFKNPGDGAFGSDSTYAVGYRPVSLYLNDLDGDGDPDAAVSNVQGGSLSILFNQGAGVFGPATTVVVDSINVGPGKNTLFEVCGNDFDGDGDIDLATADWYTGRYFILANNGTGHYEVALESDSIGIGLQNAISGDYDADGDVDLVFSNWSTGMLRVFRNGLSQAIVVDEDPNPYSFDAPPESEVAARFSMDMVPSSMSESNIFLNSDVRGRLPQQTIYDSSLRTLRIVPGGTLLPGEEVTATLGPGITSAIGSSFAPYAWRFFAAIPQGGRQFTQVGEAALVTEAEIVVSGEFGFGGAVDFAAITPQPGRLQIYFNSGGLAFTQGPARALGGRIAAAASADFDGDGDPDVALADDLGNSLRVVLSAPDSLTELIPLSLSGRPAAVSAGDMNQDGLPDLLYAVEAPRKFGIWWNTGDGFGTTSETALAAAPRRLLSFDDDADGDFDVAVLTGQPTRVRIFEHLSNGTFVLTGTFSVPVADPADLEAGDLSGDGLPDLAIADRAGSSVALLLGVAGGGFVAAGPYAAAAGCDQVRIADVDGDGTDDLVSTGRAGIAVRALFGEGGGSFGADSTYVLSQAPAGFAMADFLGSGRPEILVASLSESAVLFLENDPPTGIPAAAGPKETRLLAARPNPARPSTEIAFELAVPQRVRLRIFDIQGRLVRTLLDGPAPVGANRANWDGRDRLGKRIPSGVYVYRLDAGLFSGSGKVIVLR